MRSKRPIWGRPRFHLLKDKAVSRFQGNELNPIPDKSTSAFLLDAAAITAQGRKIALATAGGI